LNIYDFSDYKIFLNEHITRSKHIYGYQKILANRSGCQPSFFSRVLKSDSHIHLTPDQAFALGEALELKSDEQDFFENLVLLARAGTKKYKERIKEKLEKMKSSREDLATHFPHPRVSTGPDESLYYSSWAWTAIHIVSAIPQYQEVVSIAQRLNLSPGFVENCLDSLCKMGMVKKSKERYQISETFIHLPKHSAFNYMNHSNWRLKALNSIQSGEDKNLHFTGVFALSQSDFSKLKQTLLKTIDQVSDVIKRSPEEELFCFNLDFFRS
jgi:uncharacterized protein (TIGR02147 family)